MKKGFLLILIVVITFISKVNASSIVYNLNIDDEMQFHEKIVYTISNSDVSSNKKNTFLYSILHDKVYFDRNNEILYTKTKQQTSNGYVVTLRHNYSSVFFTKSRIVAECFNTVRLNNDEDGFSFLSTAPFFCSHRANNIIINISSAQNVVKSNSDMISNSIYTWNSIDRNFYINFVTSPMELNNEPMDSDHNDNSNGNDNSQNDKSNNNIKTNSLTKKVIISCLFVFFIFLIIVVFILKNKKEKLDSF